ncbi:GDP-mannose 4,6-dehydratase [Agromyces badenianii]|uniref:GDP-mannose 4,6-dehydratase n=1 Tax=Agromyces badenianii TaxID=2080742 RepID=A0A2S0WXR7_9MICO|nr:NAD-dependent epimerase/dehydratase family protein [Agromyces badenianii]AWB96149.1 GDP-mannose 4,6-dehydratase [Agromyces badenianii]PWC05010.1 GDP-mannose 4,6-dehydratase [Agromyces badenianii]
MRVLITGGAGFIGSNLARYFALHDPSVDIRVIDDLSTGRMTNLDGLDVDIRVASVADADAMRSAVEDVDAIVHLGALGSVPRSINDPMASHVANLTGTLTVLEAARSVGAYVVFASSSSVYGANLKLPKSEFDWTRPMSPYAVTKLGAEGYTLAYQFAYGLETLAFRFFNVYGPLQPADHAYAAVIPRFVDAALDGRPLVVHGDGLQSRDFTHVESVCAALFTASVDRIVAPDPVNLAFGTNTTLLELIEVLEAELGFKVAVEHTESRVGDVRASQADGLRIREYFPQIAPVPLAAGVATTVDWFKRQRGQA